MDLDNLLAQSEKMDKPIPGPDDPEYTPGIVPCEFITGPAGSGKTWIQRDAISKNDAYGVLCATTGIAAINLDATTLNSMLKFFDTDSLRDLFTKGTLTSRLHKILRKVHRLVIDEVSMMDGRQLQYIYEALEQVNQYVDMADRPGEIILTGDLAQLSPVKAPWVFEMDCWTHFDHHTTKLTKNWRQGDGKFLDAINQARAGHGIACTKLLQELGVSFTPATVKGFKGTTIMAKNDVVDNYNSAALMEVPGTTYGLSKLVWGDQAGEWKNIPDLLRLRDGAYVMILANDNSGMFEFANGDCGHTQGKDESGTVYVKLVRNEKVVGIKPIVRYKVGRGDEPIQMGLKDPYGPVENRVHPDRGPITTPHIRCEEECGHSISGLSNGPWGYPSYNCQSGTWNIGAVKYYPLRLSYASTVHKTQGLTLDNVQIDCRDPFFASPSMIYVALSRCRTPEGLTIAGRPELFAERIKLDPKVRRWL